MKYRAKKTKKSRAGAFLRLRISLVLLLVFSVFTNCLPLTTFAEETDKDRNTAEILDENQEQAPVSGTVVAAFVDYADDDHALATISVEEKSTVDAIGLPETLSVYLMQEDNVTPEGTPVDLAVTWTCDDDYENSTYDVYYFTPVLPDGYTLAEDIADNYVFISVEVSKTAGETNVYASAAETDWITAAKEWIDATSVNNGAASGLPRPQALDSSITNSNVDTWNAHMNEQLYQILGNTTNGSDWTALTWQDVPSTSSALGAWDGTVADNPFTTQAEAATTAKMIPYSYDSDADTVVDTYEVYSANQLLYALYSVDASSTTAGTALTTSVSRTIKIMCDIDFNGSNGQFWPSDINLSKNVFLKLLGNTSPKLYNLFMRQDTAGATGLISNAAALYAQDLTFMGANIMGAGGCGEGNGSNADNYPGTGVLLGFKMNYTGEQTITTGYKNIKFRHTLIMGRSSYCAPLVGRDQGETNALTRVTQIVENCNAIDTTVVGARHCGGLMGSIMTVSKINKCYAVDNNVFTYGGHSGGLIACAPTGGVIANCFTDANVYGIINCGGLTGVSGAYNTLFVNCFSSGFVEGMQNLGGFVGSIESQNYFLNCYSTALVGLNSTGLNLGGFIGNTNVTSAVITAANCYAAGEVGSASTTVDTPVDTVAHMNSNGTADYIGGFIGRKRGNTATFLWNCFYDKQTTAMREWTTGDALNNILKTTRGNSGEPFYLDHLGYPGAGYPGLNGVLTTDSTKSGEGLTGEVALGATTGFTGFTETFSNSNFTTWDTANHKCPASGYITYGWEYADDHYPQLSVFANAESTTEWDAEDQQIVANYSKTSTSTVELETWDKGLNETDGTQTNPGSTASIATTYDTVRDLTIRFNLTSDSTDAYQWYRTATQEGESGATANANGATVTINGQSYDVLKLSKGSTHYYADQFHPGLEWLKVDYGLATRRLRVMPTVGIEAGVGQTLFRPSEKAPNSTKKLAFYDHADDVELYYSTAARLGVSGDDITTGIYPETNGTDDDNTRYLTDGNGNITGRQDNALTTNQLTLSSGTSAESLTSYFATTDNLFGEVATEEGGVTTLSYPGIDASYMSREKDDEVSTTTTQTNSANGSKLRVYVKPITTFNSSDGTFATGTPFDLTAQATADAFNGKAFLPGDLSSYGYVLMEYFWELSDGRLVTDAKVLTLRNTPFSAEITTWDAGGLSGGETLAYNAAALDTSSGLLDTDDTTVNMQKVLGHIENTDVADILQDPSGTDSTPADSRYNKTYAYGGNGEQSHEFLYASYTYKEGDQDIGDNAVNDTRPLDTVGPEFMDSLIASWTVDPDKEVTKVKLRLDSGNIDMVTTSPTYGQKIYFWAEVDPRDTDTITVDYKYYRYVMSDNGLMTIVTETLAREYTIAHTTVNGQTVYYITFNHYDTDKTTDAGYTVTEADVVNNIKVELELSAKLEFDKTVTQDTTGGSGDYGDLTRLFDFKLNIVDDQRDGNNTYNYVVVDSDSDDAIMDSDGNAVTGTVTEGTEKTIQLTHGQKVKVIGLAYGSMYTLSENMGNSISGTSDVTGDKIRGYTVTTSGMTVQDNSKYLFQSTPQATNIASALADGNESNTTQSLTVLTPLTGTIAENEVYTADRAYSFINTYHNVVITGIEMKHQNIAWLMIALAIFGIGISVGFRLYRRKKIRARRRRRTH